MDSSSLMLPFGLVLVSLFLMFIAYVNLGSTMFALPLLIVGFILFMVGGLIILLELTEQDVSFNSDNQYSTASLKDQHQ